jgi:NADH:ubiquinone oxidoreductase subunit 6 (subunit J)
MFGILLIATFGAYLAAGIALLVGATLLKAAAVLVITGTVLVFLLAAARLLGGSANTDAVARPA